ncbi:hypothetical protein ACFXJ8_07265 [Nonomuraea sp. NPDC059194]|uniref:hypothetical protein n=1 Tax=Nonomuraea sp. NPDC059194 TaxID=3346764 RepID=UPI0036C8EE03
MSNEPSTGWENEVSALARRLAMVAGAIGSNAPRPPGRRLAACCPHHLKADAPIPWHGADLDFTGVTFTTDVDVTHTVFPAGTVRFTGAEFSDGTVGFDGAAFSGAVVGGRPT